MADSTWLHDQYNYSFIVVNMEDEKSLKGSIRKSRASSSIFWLKNFPIWFGGKNNGLPLIMKTHHKICLA